MDEPTARFARRLDEAADETFGRNRWLGSPARQNPFDAWIVQEIVFETKPELIVEIAGDGGGAGLLWASLLRGMTGAGDVLSIGTAAGSGGEERPAAAESLTLIDGRLSDSRVLERVREAAGGRRVMAIAGEREDRLRRAAELDTLAPIVTPGCYLVLQGEEEPTLEWLKRNPAFEADRSRERMLLTSSPSGFLRRS